MRGDIEGGGLFIGFICGGLFASALIGLLASVPAPAPVADKPDVRLCAIPNNWAWAYGGAHWHPCDHISILTPQTF